MFDDDDVEDASEVELLDSDSSVSDEDDDFDKQRDIDDELLRTRQDSALTSELISARKASRSRTSVVQKNGSNSFQRNLSRSMNTLIEVVSSSAANSTKNDPAAVFLGGMIEERVLAEFNSIEKLVQAGFYTAEEALEKKKRSQRARSKTYFGVIERPVINSHMATFVSS